MRGRHAACGRFWEDVAEGRPLAALLRSARYPLDATTLPSLLGSLCSDARSACHAWDYAHALGRATHSLPQQPSLFEARASADGRFLRAEPAQASLGVPPLRLPAGATGERLGGGLVTWSFPRESPLDMAPRLVAAVRAVTRAGAAAGAAAEQVRAAAAALELLAGAALAHSVGER